MAGRKIPALGSRILFLCLLGGFSLFAAQDTDLGSCAKMLPLVRERKSAQPIRVELSNPGTIDVHNHEFVADIAKGYSKEFLFRTVTRLAEEGAFEVPLNSKSVMVAAPRGIYSRKAWDRDHLRGLSGKRARGQTEEAKKMLAAIFKRYGNQVFRVTETLKDIEDHDNEADRKYKKEGDSSLPQVIFNPETLGDMLEPDRSVTPWSVQKDAWGLYLHSALDGLEMYNYPSHEMSREEKLALVGMFALMVKIKFWQFATTDSWEEEHQVYTGGVGLVTSALERLYDSLYAYGDGNKISVVVHMINEIIEDPNIDEKVRKIISKTLRPENVENAVKNGYQRIRKQIKAGGESPKIGISGMGRDADISLLWLFTYRLKQFSEAEYNNVLKIVETLVRPSGMFRYVGPYADGYLHPGYFFGDNEILPREMVRIDFPVKGSLVRKAFFKRKTAALNHIFGEKFSAQWGLGLARTFQAYTNMYKWFPASSNRSFYLKQRHDYALRVIATVTPGRRKDGSWIQENAIALNGDEVESYKFAEASTLVRVYSPEKQVLEELLVYSPFTQLNWYTSETIEPFRELWEEEFPDKPFPLKTQAGAPAVQ